MNTDPLAEISKRFSPYTYALNDPVHFIDPDGMSAVGADGLTDEQWIEVSRPGADPELTKQYQNKNRNQEITKPLCTFSTEVCLTRDFQQVILSIKEQL